MVKRILVGAVIFLMVCVCRAESETAGAVNENDRKQWELKKINGKDFWNVMETGYTVHDDPIYKSSALRIMTSYIRYDKDFSMTERAVAKQVETPAQFPIMAWSLRYENDFDFWRRIDGETAPSREGMERFRQFSEKYRGAWLGFCLPEFEIDLRNAANLINVGRFDFQSPDCHPQFTWKKDPAKRKFIEKHIPASFASGNDVSQLIQNEFKWMQSLLYGNVFVMTQSLTDHFFLENGATAASIELTGAGIRSHQLQAIFARGAARQYNKPWGTYIALFWGGTNPECRFGFEKNAKSPDGYSQGYYFGVSPSMHRRDLYFSYVAGANFVDHEQQNSAFWDREVNGARKRSIHGEILNEWSVFVDRNPDRGVPCTPVGLLFDYNHGLAEPDYGKKWWRFPYSDSDFMMHGILDMLIPWKSGGNDGEEKNLVSTPFGDVFDALVANPPSGIISKDVLNHYRVIVLMGDVKMTASLADELVAYVRDGGTLLINSSQHIDQFPKEFSGSASAATVSAKDAAGNPVATQTRFGKGTIYTTLPPFLIDKNKKLLPFMPDLFKQVMKDVLPFNITGNIQYMVNRGSRGWWITLINNKGVSKPPREKERIDERKTARVSVEYKGGDNDKINELVTLERLSVRKLDGSTVIDLSVPPGDIRIIEIIEQPEAKKAGTAVFTADSFETYTPGANAMRVDSGDAGRGNVIKVPITYYGAYEYIRSAPVTLNANKYGGISLWAKADQPQSIEVTFDHHTEGYIDFTTRIALTPEWKKFDLPFKSFTHGGGNNPKPFSDDMLASRDWTLTLCANKKDATSGANVLYFSDITLEKKRLGDRR
ncbi:MAG: hypothetical protein WCV67_00335 [Victivallaceae bacterium]|jgi:hypothetical protein